MKKNHTKLLGAQMSLTLLIWWLGIRWVSDQTSRGKMWALGG